MAKRRVKPSPMGDEALVAKMVDDCLTYLGCTSAQTAKSWGPAMHGLDFCIRAILNERFRRGLTRHVDPRELPESWEAAMILASEARGDLIQLGHVRTVDAAERRRLRMWGLPVPQFAKCARGSSIRVANDGHVRRSDHLYYLRRSEGGRVVWQPLTVSAVPGGERTKLRFTGNKWREIAETTFAIGAYDPELLGPIAWGMRNLWTVHLTQGDSPTLALVTDPWGVLGFFQLRDKPDGKERREALLHWVRAHGRTIRHDPEVEVEVRQHLRGKDSFTWFGLEAKVLVPPEQAALAERPASS